MGIIIGSKMIKPKILFIMHMPPPVHGAAMMGKYIHDSKIVNDAFECRYINPTTASSLEDIGKVGLRKLHAFYSLLITIRRTVKEFSPDLVYFTANACGGPFYKDFIIVELLKKMGCKIVVHYHNKGVSTRQDRWLDDCLYRHFFRGLKVILLAEALYKDVQKYVKREDVQICPNGIPESIDYELKAKRNNAVPHILFLSNLIESKGVIVLLDALKILKEKGYGFICDFVGGETAEIDASRFDEEVNKRGINDIAIYHGRKYGDEKMCFYKSSDIMVFPTFYHNECFPLVLLEAMQCGAACISTDEAAVPEIIDDGQSGYIVPKESDGKPSAARLAETIEKLIVDPERCRLMGKEGRKKYEKEYTLEVFENRITKCIGNCLK